MKILTLLVWALSLASLQAAGKPNILLVMADDLGFSDIGCYGSEIETPHLDRLAAQGLRMTQFYNTAKCHSSRVSLLTGRWCRQAGDEAMSRAVTIPEVLAPAGYFTAMTGKWHLAKEPTDFGFQRFFGHLSGATNYYRGDATFRMDGKPWQVPEQGFYTTVANVDHAIRFLGEARAARKPWFLYIAFNSPHAPLQPLENDYRKYVGRYDVGWDRIRDARVAKQKASGLLPADLKVPPRPQHVPAWEDLPDHRKSWESKRMSAYAALIDRLDQEMGRLLADLEQAGELANTLVVFVSDNGACPYDRAKPAPAQMPFDPSSNWTDSTGWAWARNAPFRYYKQNQFEGGISSPAIIHWPAGLKTTPGSVNDSPCHLVDLLPTFAEVAEATVPDSFPGRQPTSLAGISLAPVLRGSTIAERPPIHLLFDRDRGLRDGEWKLVSFQSQPWELYHIGRDRTEMDDVAAEHPAIVKRLSTLWMKMSREVLLCKGREIAPVADQATEQRHHEWTQFKPAALKPFTPAADLAGEWAFDPDPNLPDVLILGDSISIGYTRATRSLMKGIANVHRPMAANGKTPANCGDTNIGLANLDAWLGQNKWDIIHFNWGLWDLCYRHPDSKNQGNRDKVHGKVSLTPDQYAENLEKLVLRMKATGARLIWASTTLVPEGEQGRFAGDEKKYNAIAAAVMKRHGIATNDLHALTQSLSPKPFVKPGDVHLTEKGYQLLAAQVAATIKNALP